MTIMNIIQGSAVENTKKIYIYILRELRLQQYKNKEAVVWRCFVKTVFLDVLQN